jgi:phosphoglycerol transferase MdoB-like AlkP superfamily enzyme
MNLKFIHLLALTSSEYWGVGPVMLFESVRTYVFLVLSIVLTSVLTLLFPLQGVFRNTKILFVFLLLASLSNAVVIRLRHQPHVHTELRYNPLLSLYEDWKRTRSKGLTNINPPSRHELIESRSLLGAHRQYNESTKQLYPFWQTRTAKEDTHKTGDLQSRLRSFIREENEKKPWNIILVLSESLRAHELDVFSSRQKMNLTPHINRIAKNGVLFSEVMSAGFQTNIGQVATLCSLYTFEPYAIMNSAPMTQANCLTDIFTQKNWETYFFYAGDNTFDNQATFYSHHKVRHIYGEEAFPKDRAKAGWGYSDHELFELSLKKLRSEKAPFFSVIMTLTNHEPFNIPNDAPDNVFFREAPLPHQMIQYADWSFGNFYESVKAEFPHTLVIFVADHGTTAGELDLDFADLSVIRKITRIPLFIVSPEFPKELQGQNVSVLASNVDIAPTLLNLFGWEHTPQQFMGTDAFLRKDPVYVNFFGKLKTFSSQNGVLSISNLSEGLYDKVNAVTRFNLLAPPQ